MPERARTERAQVALLRGINVGGRNKLPMSELVRLLSGIGCLDVRTYIQSGNVVYLAGPALAARVPVLAAAAIKKDLGLTVPVVTRSGVALEAVARENPFAAEDPATLHVGFLADAPSEEAVAALDPERSPPDRFQVHGGEIYLCLPNGVARSKLTNDYFDRTLGTICTIRNWKTVLALLELVRAA